MSTYTLLLDFGQGYADYSSTLMAEGFNLKEAVGAGGKHQTQTCQLMIRDEALTSRLYGATENVKAQLKKDGAFIFSGIIRPYISYTAQGIDIGKVSIEIIDFSELLDVYVYPKNEYVDKGAMEAEFEGFYVFNPSQPTKSLVHKLAGLCGISSIVGDSYTKVISQFVLPGDSYIKDVLEDLLYQHELDYRFLADGTMKIISTSISSEPTVTCTDFRNSFKHQKSDSSDEGCLLTYRTRVENKDVGYKIATYDKSFSTDNVFDVTIGYSDIVNNQDVSLNLLGAINESKVIPPGCTLEWWKLKNVRAATRKGDKGDFSTRATVNSWSQDDSIANITAGYKGTIWMFQTNHLYVDLYGTFDYVYKSATRAGASGNNPLTYDAKYIYSLEEAQAFAEALAKKQNVNRYIYSFNSFSVMEPNTLVTLKEDALLGLEAKVRILSRSVSDDTGLYAYTAEGAGESELDPPIPVFTPVEVEYRPSGEPLEVYTSHTTIYDSDQLQYIGATAAGYIRDYYQVSAYEWRVNGAVMSETSSNLTIPLTLLTNAVNTIQCKASYDGNSYAAGATVRLVNTARSISLTTDGFAYSYDGKGDLSPSEQLIKVSLHRVGVDGMPAWRINNTPIDTTADTIEVPASYMSGYRIAVQCNVGIYETTTYIYKISDGSDIYYQWCLSSSYIEIPEEDKLPRLFMFTEGQSQYMLYDNMPISSGGMWQGIKPTPSSEKPYIWERSSNDYGETWSEPVCITPVPHASIVLNSSKNSYIADTAGYVLEQQQIIVSVTKIGHNEPAYWTVKQGAENYNYSNVEYVLIDIPSGFRSDSIIVSCLCASVRRTITIYPEKVAKRTPVKLSVVNISQLASLNARDDGSPLIEGDYRLVSMVSGGKTYHVPYAWNGSAWQGVTASTSNYAEVIMNLLPDAMNLDDAVPEISALYGFFETLGANAVVAELVSSLYIHVRKAIYGGNFTKEGTFDSGARVSQGFHLGADGFLRAVDADLSGSISVDHSFVKKGVFKSDRFYPERFF